MKIIIMICIIVVIIPGFIAASPTGWRNEIIIKEAPGSLIGYCHGCITTDAYGRIHTLTRLNGAEGYPRCWDVEYFQSTNTGVTWSGSPGFSFGTGDCEYRSTDIAIQGNEVMVAFQRGYESPGGDWLNYYRSTDGGITWPPYYQYIKIADNGINPRLAVENEILHTFYSFKPGSTGYEIYRKQSTDGGENWSSEQRLTIADRNSWHPAVSVNANAIHLVWADNRGVDPQNYEIFYDRSTDHGLSWIHNATSGFQMTQAIGISEYPDIVAYTDPNYHSVHVIWMDDRTGYPGPGVYYLRSTDNGANWPSYPTLILADGHHSAIAADGRGLFVVCEKNADLYYIESSNWGTSWNSPINITYSSTYYDSFPDIAADAMGRHIVFDRHGEGLVDSRLFYKQRDIIFPSAPVSLRKDPLCVPPPVVLLWNANSESDLYDYRVYRRQLPSGKWATIGTAKNATYTDNTVSGGYWYEYYVTARDLALNESSASNVIQVYIPEPKKIVDLGLPEPSAYTLERTGYYEWGGTPDSTADFGLSLRYRLTGFIPENDYSLGFVFFEPACDSGRTINLRTGNFLLDSLISVPESALCLSFHLPAAVYGQGKVDLALTGQNRNAVLSQILIWERARGGTQSVGSGDINGNHNLIIYPNPAYGRFTFTYNLPTNSLVSIELCDCAGRVLSKREEYQTAGCHEIELDSKRIGQGIYYILVKSNNTFLKKKIVYCGK